MSKKFEWKKLVATCGYNPEEDKTVCYDKDSNLLFSEKGNLYERNNPIFVNGHEFRVVHMIE